MIQPATRYECSKRVVTVLPPGQNAPVEIRVVPRLFTPGMRGGSQLARALPSDSCT